jgi:Fe-S oxidoreductase
VLGVRSSVFGLESEDRTLNTERPAPNTEHRTPNPEVILWPDTFNDHFTPEVARAAVEVLESAGYQVRVPEQDLC